MRQRIAVVITGLFLLSAGGRAQNAGSENAPGAPRAILVELFTSEGCSSCPPADTLLQRLNGTKTNDGDLIVGISEHVTYWNHDGWTDPFSTDIATQRQSDYVDRIGRTEVYTPQMIVNGETAMVGSDQAAVARALAKAHRDPAMVLHIDSAHVDGDHATATFNLKDDGTRKTGVKRVDIYAVVAEDLASTKVLRGENAGHTLSHVAVARTFAKVATIGAGESKTIVVPLPNSPKSGPSPKRHLILFAQTPNLGPVLSVDSAPL